MTPRRRWAAVGGLLAVAVAAVGAISIVRGNEALAAGLMVVSLLLLIPFRAVVTNVQISEARYPRSGPRRRDEP